MTGLVVIRSEWLASEQLWPGCPSQACGPQSKCLSVCEGHNGVSVGGAKEPVG